MSRDETPDTTGLREAVGALADEWETAHGNPPVDPSHISVRHAQRLRALLAAHPTRDASPDPAVVTPDAGDVEALAQHIYEASDCFEEEGVAWENQYGSPMHEAMTQARAILASDWLANHVAAAREADRAEVERAITEHAAHMGTYTIPAMSPGFIDGYHQALRLLARDAEAIAHRATRGES